MRSILFFGILLAFFGIGNTAEAANLYFSPSTGSYKVGSNISVGVYVGSADQAMNAVSGAFSFPQDKLEVISLSKSSSIITLWVQEPVFSNSKGTGFFEGIVLNPGFTGGSGEIITVNFRVKAAGTATLNFSSGSVLANDGQGTNILAGLGTASFSLVSAVQAVPKATTPSKAVGAPAVPRISSSTHPDPDKWYAIDDAKFAWILPSDVNASRLLVGKIPNAIPIVYYSPAVSSKVLPGVADGVWYFHVRLNNSSGWGGSSHFRFQIDTEEPSRFEIRKVERDDETDPRTKFVFDAEDETSGIDHYEIQIDNGSLQVWKDDGSGIFETPSLGPGEHVLIAKAVDKAGNALTDVIEFTVEALEPPKITQYPKELESGEILIVKGSTYPKAQVILWIQREKEDAKSHVIESDRDGNFILVVDEKLNDGIYTLWAEVVSVKGAISGPLDKITIVVEQPVVIGKSEVLKLRPWAIDIRIAVVLLLMLILLLLYLLWHIYRKFKAVRKRVLKDVSEAEKSLHHEFDLLKETIREQIKVLEKAKTKHQLTIREEKVIKQLKGNLDEAEKAIRKEIKDIGKYLS